MEKILKETVNKELASDIQRLIQKELPQSQNPTETLSKIRSQILQISGTPELKKICLEAFEKCDLSRPGEFEGAKWEEAFKAMKGVWASKWNDRAYYASKKAGINQEQIHMAVLVQRMVEAEYSFVIHTVNPITQDKTEMYAELVIGLGETLVGNYPGRALGFVCKKDGSSDPQVLTLPSKSTALLGKGLIFRSDSNGEDLPDFAGAGLYDSIPMTENRKKTIAYCREALMTNADLVDEIMRGVCRVAADVEKAMGGQAQDIEGCYSKGRFYVVQTRPQV